jgi:hypothetical protein
MAFMVFVSLPVAFFGLGLIIIKRFFKILPESYPNQNNVIGSAAEIQVTDFAFLEIWSALTK